MDNLTTDFFLALFLLLLLLLLVVLLLVVLPTSVTVNWTPEHNMAYPCINFINFIFCALIRFTISTLRTGNDSISPYTDTVVPTDRGVGMIDSGINCP